MNADHQSQQTISFAARSYTELRSVNTYKVCPLVETLGCLSLATAA